MSEPTFPSVDPAERLARLLRYLDSDPTNPALLRDAVDSCLSLVSAGRHADAAPALARLLRLHPDSHLAYNLAYAQMQSGDADAARETLASFVSAEPEAPLAALWVTCLHRLADVQGAIAFARTHEARLATGIAFLGAAALAYLDGEAFDDADRAARASLAIDGDSVDALIVRGSLSLGRADAAAALGDLARASHLRPHDGRALSGLGMAQLLSRDAAAARTTLQNAVARMPTHIGTWHALGWACISLKSLNEAAAAMAHALDIDRNFGESHGAVAVVAALAGRREEAQASIDRALRLDPRGLSARYAQMVLSGEAADPQRFERTARRVLSSRSLPGGLTVADLLPRLK